MLGAVGGTTWEPASAQVQKENQPANKPASRDAAKPSASRLDPTWMFNAALLSTPVDLSSLILLSRDNPRAVVREEGLMAKLVAKVLNVKDSKRVDKDTKLDVLMILANCASLDDVQAKVRVRDVLDGITSWFEQYLQDQESKPKGEHMRPEPELHKAMLLLLSRAYDYTLRTENLLELCGGDRQLALEAVVGVLDDGESVLTEIKQRVAPGIGQRGQWEEQTTVVRHEKPLIVQMCQLLMGFTRPDTYFSSLDEGFYFMEAGLELPEYCIGKFADEVEQLLAITLRTRLVESLSEAMNRALFSDGQVLDTTDHEAVIAVHGFFQNLYLFSAEGAEEYTSYLLMDTLMVPHLVLPYLERCVYHAAVLTRKAQANRDALKDFDGFADMLEMQSLVDEVSDLSLDYPELCQGMEATLRTMVLCTFRAPRTRVMCQLLHKFNPTHALLRLKSFVARHDYVFSLLLMLNVNMGTFDVAALQATAMDEDVAESAVYAFGMLHEMASVYEMMNQDAQRRVLRRVETSGAVPVARDTPSYGAVLGILWGGGASQLEYAMRIGAAGRLPSSVGPRDTIDFTQTLSGDVLGDLGEDAGGFSETVHWNASRKAVKQEANERVQAHLQDQEEQRELERLEADRGGGLRPTISSQEDVAAAMAATLSRFRHNFSLEASERDVFADTFTREVDAATEELEKLDQLVADDLARCQAELDVLAAEVRALQMGGEDEEEEDLSAEDSEPEAKGLAASDLHAKLGSVAVAVPPLAAAEAKEELTPEPTAEQPPPREAKAAADVDAQAAEPALEQPKPRRRGKKTSRGPTRPAPADDHGRPQRSLLGDLPTLSRARVAQGDIDTFVNLQLELPKRERDMLSKRRAGERQGYIKDSKGLFSPGSCKRVSSGVDESFACAINGHMMKDPVRAPNGQVFEKATVLLWLETRGSVCPITGDPLTADQLVADTELRNRIMRHRIQKAFTQQQQQQQQQQQPAASSRPPQSAATSRQSEAMPPGAVPAVAAAAAGGAAAAAPPIADDLYDF